MTADVIPDRRVTVPTRGFDPAFVDGSRLYWALPSPVHEGFWLRHQARPDTRLCGAFRMLITAQSRINDVRLLTARPFAPDRATLAPCSLPSRRGLATTELVVTTSRRPALPQLRAAHSRYSRHKKRSIKQRTIAKGIRSWPVINPSIGARGTRSLLPDRRSLLTVPIQGGQRRASPISRRVIKPRAPCPRGEERRCRTACARRALKLAESA